MSEPFIGQIQIFPYNFAPRGWAFCQGQIMSIAQNTALFSLLGTTYGGDGRVNFALPDLRGQVPIHRGSGFTQGQKGGEQAHTVTISEMPTHTHVAQATSVTGTANAPTPSLMLAVSTPQSIYGPPTNLDSMFPTAVSNVGGSQAHLNMQPFLVLSFCIALQGIFPSQT